MKEVLYAIKRLSGLVPSPVTVSVQYDARDDNFWFKAAVARNGGVWSVGKTVSAQTIETAHDADGLVVIMVSDFIRQLGKSIKESRDETGS